MTVRNLKQKKTSLCGFELRPIDYRQIELWAEENDMSAEKLLTTIIDSSLQKNEFSGENPGKPNLWVKDGAITTLSWDVSALPKLPQQWLNGLEIESFTIYMSQFLDWDGTWPCHGLFRDDKGLTNCLTGTTKLKNLKRLILSHIYIPSLGCCAPGLESLKIMYGRLEALELEAENLVSLHCNNNALTQLDLSSVPSLSHLDCSGNFLSALDLSKTPSLKTLECCDNRLSELDLSKTPSLTALYCANNTDLSLELTGLADLRKLTCENTVTSEDQVDALANISFLRSDFAVIKDGTKYPGPPDDDDFFFAEEIVAL